MSQLGLTILLISSRIVGLLAGQPPTAICHGLPITLMTSVSLRLVCGLVRALAALPRLANAGT